MKLSDIKTGYSRINAGEFVGGIPYPMFDGVRLKVRRIWNTDFAAEHEKLVAGGKTEDEAFNECLVTVALIDWEGIDDPYDPATGRALLADPEVGAVFRNAIVFAANRLGSQVKAELEADEKN